MQKKAVVDAAGGVQLDNANDGTPITPVTPAVPITKSNTAQHVKATDAATAQPKATDAVTKSKVGSKASKEVERAQNGKTFFSKSKRFQKLVDHVYASIDTDNSGEIDKQELYAGLILIHLRLAAYVGPAACRPATKEYVEEIFDLLDHDGSGQLNRQEFGTVITVLLSQIMTRVCLHLVFPLVIIPLVAQYLLDFMGGITGDERFMTVAESTVNNILPDGLKSAMLAAREKIDEIIPDDLWTKLPLTLITAVLGMLLVPWTIFQIDEFFSKMAASKKKKEK